MDLINKAKAVKLRSHLDKYLVADDDKVTVRQSRNAATRRSIWVVELSPENAAAVRLKSFSTGLYLSASDVPFLLGMTGKRVVQSAVAGGNSAGIDWEPLRDGFQVKLRGKKEGKFLRANGGPPPWRNSVTHDVPAATVNWTLWDVEAVGLPELWADGGDVPSLPSSELSEDDSVGGASPLACRLSMNKAMDLINKAKAVKLRSHLDKYLVADDDKVTVRQSRNAATRRSIWVVELSPENAAAVRLKSFSTGLYLSASDVPFLLGMTGKRVVQSGVSGENGAGIDWEPVRDGFQVKLRGKKEGKFLRANGGPPPWRNSVTHDVPAATVNWTLWDVEAVGLPDLWADGGDVPSLPSSELSEDDFVGGSLPASPLACRLSMNKTAMDFFTNAKAVRLRSHHGKYLTADEDEEAVTQNRNGSSRSARWAVEFVNSGGGAGDYPSLIRLRSCYGKYLTATDHHFLLGMTGRKVLQTLPPRLDSSVEWEPVRQGKRVKLRTRSGDFLRANGGLPPWRNSVTHDLPHRTATQDWVLWDVDIVEITQKPSPPPPVTPPLQAVAHADSFSSESSDYAPPCSPPRSDGRVIYYHIADEDGTVDDGAGQGYPLTFKGNTVEELAEMLKGDTGIQDIIVCTRSPLNGKLYPLRLQLPPATVSMHVVVVPSPPADDL